MKDYERGETTQFNMSLATLERINSIIIKLNQYRLLAHPLIVVRLLSLLSKEIHPFLKADEKKEMLVMTHRVNQYVATNWNGKELDFQPLDLFEVWLRDQLHAKGLLMARGEDPAFSLK